MKDYVITVWNDDQYAVHHRVGGCAYIAVFFGTHNEVASWLKAKGINDVCFGE